MPKKVVFVSFRDLHFPVLYPIYKELLKLNENNQYEIGFMAPSYQESGSGVLQEGLSKKNLTKIKEEKIPFWGWQNEPVQKFDAVVYCDVNYSVINGWGPIVNVGHGTISKGVYFTDDIVARRENFATALCVPGERFKKSYGEQVFTNTFPTGFSKMDSLTKYSLIDKNKFYEKIGFTADKKTILFAPTFNFELTSMEILFEAWQKLDKSKFQIIIKLHAAALKEFKEYYKKLASLLDNVFYATDSDISSYMYFSDYLVSDVSSVYVEYISLNKPIILLNNPRMKEFSSYNEKNLEYQLRDCAYQINDVQGLLNILLKLEENDPLKEKREDYRISLFPERDGKNSLRIAEIIKKVATNKITFKYPENFQKLKVVVGENSVDLSIIEENLNRAALCYEVNVFNNNHFNYFEERGYQVSPIKNWQSLQGAIVFFKGIYLLDHEWDQFWYLSRNFNREEGIYAPILSDDCQNSFQRNNFIKKNENSLRDEIRANLYKYFTYPVNKTQEVTKLETDCLFVTKSENLTWSSFAKAEITAKAEPFFVLEGLYGTKKNGIQNDFEDDFLTNNLKEKKWQGKKEIYEPHIKEIRKLREVSEPKISIIIVSIEFSSKVAENLRILHEEVASKEIIFVNNGCSREEFSQLEQYTDTYIWLKRNVGAYKSRNLGSVFANGEILLFIDDDAIPKPGIINDHLRQYDNFEVIAVRGVCFPVSNNLQNKYPRHYYWGNKPFPRFPNIEGNTSFLAKPFFKIGGWDNDIKFGGGGLEISYRLHLIEPDLRKQMYSPDPVIYHDYVRNEKHLKGKREKQFKSKGRLYRKYSDYLVYQQSWRKFLFKTCDLIQKRNYQYDSLVTSFDQKLAKSVFINYSGFYDFYFDREIIIRKKSNPVISIIITDTQKDVKSERFIENLNHNHKDIELVLVTNLVKNEVIDNFVSFDKIIIVQDCENTALYRNLGAINAKAPLCLFCDNIIIDQKLVFEHLKTLAKFDVSAVFGKNQGTSEKYLTPAFLQNANSISIKKEMLFQIFGWNENCENCELDLSLNILKESMNYASIIYNSKCNRLIEGDFRIDNSTLKHDELLIWNEIGKKYPNVSNTLSLLSCLSKEKEDQFESLKKMKNIFPYNFKFDWNISLIKIEQNNFPDAIKYVENISNFIFSSLTIESQYIKLLFKLNKPEKAVKRGQKFLQKYDCNTIQKLLVDYDLSVVSSESGDRNNDLLSNLKTQILTGNSDKLLKSVINYLQNIGESKELAVWLKGQISSSGTIQPANNHLKTIVSIVIPCYNYGEYIEECLLSILKQTYHNWEALVVDDGSIDNSREVIRQFKDKYPGYNIRIFEEEHKGLGYPRNLGVSKAKGKYVLPLDADDFIAPDFLQKTVEVLDNNQQLAYVSTKSLFFGVSNKIWPRSDFNPLRLFVTNQQTNTTLYRKEMWEDIKGYSTEMNEGYIDWEFWIKATKRGWLGTQIDEPLFIYRRKDQSVVMKAKNKDVYLKQKIMSLHPDIYDISRLKNPETELSRKNYIPEYLIRSNLKIPKRNISVKMSHRETNKTKKVLFVCHDFPPHRFAGAQLYAKNLAQKLNEENLCEVEVFYPIVRGDYEKLYEIREKEYEGLKVFELTKEISHETGKVYNENVARIFKEFLLQHNYDLVHFHGFGQLSISPLDICQQLGIKTALTLHDYWLLCDHWHMIRTNQNICSGPESLEKCANCFIEDYGADRNLYNQVLDYEKSRKEIFKTLFEKIDKVFSPSYYLKTVFGKYGFKNIEVNALGFNYQDYHKVRRIDNKKIIFGYAGQIIKRKGVNFIVEAFKKCQKPNIELHIWGPIEEENSYTALIKELAKGDKRVKFYGRYEHNELSKIIPSFDITLIPSLMENYPLVVQESFIYQTPVIATKVGGIPEVVTHEVNGFLVEAGSQEGYEKYFGYLAENPDEIVRTSKNIVGVKKLKEDALFYNNVYQSLTSKKVIDSDNPKFLFYFFKNVHIPTLLPIYKKLKELKPNAEIAFSYLKPRPEIRAGLNEKELSEIKVFGETIYEVPQQYQADITFIADAVYPWVRNCGFLVNVGHGILSKGQYYTNTAMARREEEAGLVCVPGKYHEKVMKNIISTPVVTTGMAKLDKLFDGSLQKQDIEKELGLPVGHFKYLLFAPTFNDELSAIPFVRERITEVIPDENTLLIIKLHGSAKKEYQEMYAGLVDKHPQVIYSDDSDISKFMILADVLISDVSSVIMEFAALDKPLILFDNPNQTNYQNYNPDDIEYKFRDHGIRVNNLEEMKLAVKRSFDNPVEFQRQRQFCAEQMIANKKGGNAAEMIIKSALSSFKEKMNIR